MNQPPDPNSPSDVDPMQIEEQGHLVAAMPASPGAPILWVPAMSVQGTRVQEASTSARCPDPAQIKYCLP